MKHNFPYKEGDEVTLFEDWENEKNPIGVAKLIKFHKLGLTFILKETFPEEEQQVYNYQEWITSLGDTPFKIRYIDTVGIANSADDNKKPGTDQLPIDSFIIINGIEVF